MNLSFFQASESDISVIFEQAKSLIDSYEDIAAIDYDKVLAWVKRKITANISQYTRVSVRDEICAYYRLCGDGELDDLYVLPDFRERGIGTEIMNRCIAESVESIWLYVFTRNTRAISFYERFGFTVRETVGATRVIMSGKG